MQGFWAARVLIGCIKAPWWLPAPPPPAVDNTKAQPCTTSRPSSFMHAWRGVVLIWGRAEKRRRKFNKATRSECPALGSRRIAWGLLLQLWSCAVQNPALLLH